jgi:hypothetical protein
MPVEVPTNAQSLRVIGQQLAGLGVDFFEVEKSGAEYVVWMQSGESAGKSREKALLNSISQNIRQPADSAEQHPSPMRLQPAQILQADSDNRLRRLQPTELPDPYNLSTVLRVLGDYLDRKGADEFAIAYDSASLTVQYGQKSESLRIDDLYDLGVRMYLRRSNRARAR